MKKITKYLIEKLHLDKNIKVQSEEIKKILLLIEDYIISFTYIGKWDNKRECDVKEVANGKIEIYIEQEIRTSFWNQLGKDIVKKINNDLHIKTHYETNVDNAKIYILIDN